MFPHRRHSVLYENLSEKFLVKGEEMEASCFHQQYYHMYRTRVKLMQQRIVANAKELLGDCIEPCRLTKAEKNRKALVVGTVMKRIKLRPSVLRDLAEEQVVLPQPIAEDRLIGEDDYLEFEDDDQIVRLSGDLNMDCFATGCIVGLYGMQLDNDIFHVDRVIWPCKALQPAYPRMNDDRYIMFVSGFSFTGQVGKDIKKLLLLDLLQKWLSGLLPLSQKERGIVERLVRLVVAGESVAITDQGREFTAAARYLIRNEECPNVECAAHMDGFLSKIINLLEVDLMPGLGDPSTHLMPQQPIHRAVFPKSSAYGKMLNLVTNPYQFSLEGVHILGTSGENLSDLRRFSRTSGNIDLLCRILDWQHLAPTVPDTVDGFPLVNRDPFIIETFPHILFAANQLETSSALMDFEDGRRTLLLSVPSFTKTYSAVLVNLRNLQVIEHSFSVDHLISDSMM